MKYSRAIFLALSIFFLIGATLYSYTGPGNRTITTSVCKVELYECQWIDSKSIYKYHLIDDWSCSNESKPWQAYPSSGPTCSASTEGSQYWSKNPNAGSSSTTYPPATINAVTDCATPGNAGWCKNGPQVNFTVNEPISGETITRVEGTVNSGALKTFCTLNLATGTCSWTPADGISNISAWAVSTWGDTSLKDAVTAKADQVAPALSVPLSPDGANGWYLTPPTLTLSASDATSGLASAAFDTGSNTFTPPADGIYPLTATALDVAGNSASANITVKLDGTAPSLSIPVSPDGKNGWYKTVPTISLITSDATSGLDFASFDLGGSTFTPASDGVFNLAATARDLAGNTTKKTAALKVDSTDPLLSIPTSPDGANGWYLTSPTLTLSASDATSGLASAQLDSGGMSITITQDGVHVISASGEDNAGNTASISKIVKKDSVAPALSIPTAPDGDNGWYKTRPTLTLAVSDATSGLDFVQFDASGTNTFTPASDGVFTLNATAKDLAGNTTTRSATIKVDTTAPTLTLPFSPSGANGWYTAPSLTFTLSASDSGSGLQSARFTDAGGAVLVNDTTVSITADGVYTLQATARDNAGNVKNLSVTVKKDSVSPLARLTPWPPNGANGWFTILSTFKLSGTDATSGVDKAFFTATNTDTFTPPADGIYPVTGTVLDLAGNSISTDYTLKLDSLAPALAVSTSPAVPDGANGWYKTMPNLAITASDATSGLDYAQFNLPGNPNKYTPPGDGLYNLEALARDVAGNTTSQKTALKVDTTAPAIAIPTSPDGQNGWYVTSPTISFTASDATSGLESAAFSDGSTSVTLAEGVHPLEARAVDKAGNQSIATKTILVDTTPPELALAVNNTPVANDWYAAPVETTASASDSTSGLALLEYQLNGGTWTTGAAAKTVQDGMNLVSFRVRDRAGNQTLASRALKVDTTPPQTSFLAPASLANVSETVTFKGSTTDAASGVSSVAYSLDGGRTWLPLQPGDWSFQWNSNAVPDGPFEIQVKATDLVGNSAVQSIRVNVGNRPPLVSLQESWQAWEAGEMLVRPRNDIPLESVTLTVSCAPYHPDSVQTFDPNNLPDSFQWDLRCGDGAYASFASEFQAILTACDIFGRCSSASGTIFLPEMQITATATATITPTATATRTLMPSTTATVAAITPTPLAPVPEPEPVQLPWLWVIAAAAGLCLVFGANSLSDPRPAAIRRLGKTWKKLLSPHD